MPTGANLASACCPGSNTSDFRMNGSSYTLAKVIWDSEEGSGSSQRSLVMVKDIEVLRGF